jgi:hypothetical protein
VTATDGVEETDVRVLANLGLQVGLGAVNEY